LTIWKVARVFKNPLPQQNLNGISTSTDPRQVVFWKSMNMMVNVYTIVNDLLRRAKAKVNHVADMQNTHAQINAWMKFNTVEKMRILVNVEVIMGAIKGNYLMRNEQ
jgi:hypothetical protein